MRRWGNELHLPLDMSCVPEEHACKDMDSAGDYNSFMCKNKIKQEMPNAKIMPKISVIMSVYNGGQYLKASIESIIHQTYADFEFIIINDGSTDASLKIIEGYGGGDARIRIISNGENIGLTKSLNKALKVASGEYIARQDADDISLPSRLELQLNYLESHLQVALLGTGIYVVDADGRKIEKRIMQPNPRVSLQKGNRIAHGSVMFRKAVIDGVGSYNEALKYAQDYELWLRMAKRHEVRNLPTPLYKLRMHGGSILSKKAEEQQMCAILAQKLARGEITEGNLLDLQDHPLSTFQTVFTRDDKMAFHKAAAYNHTQRGDLPALRRECFKAVILSPLDLENDVQLFSSLFGVWGVRATHQLYRHIRYVSHRFAKLKM